MELDQEIERVPLDYRDPRVRGLLDAAITLVPMPQDVLGLIKAVGLNPGELPFGAGSTGAQLWLAVFDKAAENLRTTALVDEIARRKPAFAQRLAELRTAVPPMERPAADPPGPSDYVNFSDDGRLERQIVQGMPTLLDVRFLALGVASARAVCLIEAQFQGAISRGTGFLIGPRRILTNHHVVFDEEDADRPASSVQVQFGKELDLGGKLLVPMTIEAGAGDRLRGERTDDWAVVELDADPPAGTPVLSIAGPQRPLEVDDRVAIIQHPKGLPKKIALAHNLVRHVDDQVVQYWTDTDEGSSGAPVFNEQWEVVALHHASRQVGDDQYGYRNQGRNIVRVAARVQDVAG